MDSSSDVSFASTRLRLFSALKQIMTHFKPSKLSGGNHLRMCNYMVCGFSWRLVIVLMGNYTVSRQEGGGGGSDSVYPTTRRSWPNAGLMFAHRLRRWTNIELDLGQWGHGPDVELLPTHSISTMTMQASLNFFPNETWCVTNLYYFN